MKTAESRRSHAKAKPRINLQSQTFSLSNAKTYLGRLVKKASRGEAVYIMAGGQRFILQEIPEIEPIPIRPPNYFANVDSRADIQEQNRLAKASVIKPPKDIE